MQKCKATVGASHSHWEVIFVPGWGLETRLWAFVEAVLMRIPGLNMRCMAVELGSALSLPRVTAFRLGVGHSAGFLWLLQQRPFSLDGLVAVNGFTRFVAGTDFPEGVEAELLQRMLFHVQQDPAAVVTAFLRRCGAFYLKSVNIPLLILKKVQKLREGLIWLQEWDGRPALIAESAPLLVLAGGADRIVTPAMTKACFCQQSDRNVFWQSTGGHLLPLSHPEWLAMHIWQFALQLCTDKIQNMINFNLRE